MGHFSLDVDPDQLEAAGNGLVTLGEHLDARSTEIKNTPGEVPESQWKGAARDAIMKEVEALGNQAAAFGPKFVTAGESLKTLATKCRTAVDTTLASLNSRWEGAQQTYRDDVGKADTKHQQSLDDIDPSVTGPARKMTRMDLDEVRTNDIATAAQARTATENQLRREFDTVVADLERDFTNCSRTLADSTLFAMSDETAAEFLRRGMTGLSPGEEGFPPELGADDAMAMNGAVLVRDKHDLIAGEAAAKEFNEFFRTGPHSRQEIDRFLGTLDVDSPAFRAGFVNNLDLDTLFFLQRVAHGGVGPDDAASYGKVITAVGRMMAAGSNPELQGNYPVRPSFYGAWRDKAETMNTPPGEGYLYVAEIVQAGQNGAATWDSGLITEITRDTIAFEQEQRKENPHFSWGEVWRTGSFATRASLDMFGEPAGRADAVAMLLDGLQHDRDASLSLLQNRDGTADTDMLHYLYDGRRNQVGWAHPYGVALGGVLDSATSFTGSGGKGSPEYASAQIVSDFVGFFGKDPSKLWPGMEQDVVDIMTHHIQAVNATLGQVTWEGDVHVGDPDGLLARDRQTLAVIDPAALEALMTKTFALDYYAENGKRPLFQQFAAVQSAALKQDFLALASNPDAPPGRLEQIAGQHGTATTRTAGWLKSALVGEGAGEDAANAAARDAADWVLGLATDQIPLDRLPGGPVTDLAGTGVDGVKGWAIDQLIPETHAEADAEKSADELAAEQRTQNALVHLNWLDEADMLGDAAPESWVTANPGRTDFLERGPGGRWVLKDTVELYQQRKDDPQAWNQFVDYWNTQGDPKLRNEDLYENYELGAITG